MHVNEVHINQFPGLLYGMEKWLLVSILIAVLQNVLVLLFQLEAIIIYGIFIVTLLVNQEILKLQQYHHI